MLARTVVEKLQPSGFWSGPLSICMIKDQPRYGESGHEEVYYHVSVEKRAGDSNRALRGPITYGWQKMRKAFSLWDKSIFAIPGAVTCGRLAVSELLYFVGLAGKGEALMMKDHPEFVHLKSFENFLKMGGGKG